MRESHGGCWPAAKASFPHEAFQLRGLGGPLATGGSQPLREPRVKLEADGEQHSQALLLFAPSACQFSTKRACTLMICSGHFRVRRPARALRVGQAAGCLFPGRPSLEVLPLLFDPVPFLLLRRWAPQQ